MHADGIEDIPMLGQMAHCHQQMHATDAYVCLYLMPTTAFCMTYALEPHVPQAAGNTACMHAYMHYRYIWHSDADCEPVGIEQVSAQVQMVDHPKMLA